MLQSVGHARQHVIKPGEGLEQTGLCRAVQPARIDRDDHVSRRALAIGTDALDQEVAASFDQIDPDAGFFGEGAENLLVRSVVPRGKTR